MNQMNGDSFSSREFESIRVPGIGHDRCPLVGGAFIALKKLIVIMSSIRTVIDKRIKISRRSS